MRICGQTSAGGEREEEEEVVMAAMKKNGEDDGDVDDVFLSSSCRLDKLVAACADV